MEREEGPEGGEEGRADGQDSWNPYQKIGNKVGQQHFKYESKTTVQIQK